MKFILPIVGGLVLIAACTIVQGRLTERWSLKEAGALEAVFKERLNNVPLKFGDWDSEPGKVDQAQLEAARVVGHFERIYTNRRKPSQKVSVYLVCGSPRHITDHNPDNCYVCQGYTEVGTAQKFKVTTETSEGEFYHESFTKDTPQGTERLRIFWAWNSQNVWESPTVARLELQNRDALYKMYVITEGGGPEEGDVSQTLNVTFLHEFIPQLERALFPAETAASAAKAEAATQPAT